ncbi:25S rRNA (uracil2843-N3)-methyltransferase [Aspergillus chevalieri]|uniref:25S rRNA (Uridine(2843)-N(3))-methyltransferase n=1 Tax=Aspergillus chevalieri TaxID=182096 RepID=A0A7R7ZMC2_ASPCH|nr:uncharacterized protein ACHE_30466A [Aspergillus chevalieri]BCR86479.1 hypothetical protein ACHE_30466A [Aspergillus chevalieri]
MPHRPGNKKSNPNSSKKRAPEKKPQRQHQLQHQRAEEEPTPFDNPTNIIPLTLQQLLLNVFQSALVPNTPASQHDQQNQRDTNENEGELDLKPLIQTIKSHLYNRDFDSAFTDANEELLRAYALRWSASRTLGYAGVFKAVLGLLSEGKEGRNVDGQVVCIGGGAGAEIVALAGVWRDIVTAPTDEGEGRSTGLKVTAVDIADWSGVVGRLDGAMRSPKVLASKSHPAPLLPDGGGDKFGVAFQKADVLSLPEEELKSLYGQGTVMVTLMFTLNELFSTSIAKATAFLLRTTDVVEPGTLFLVVDSPGSYSSLSLGKTTDTGEKEKVERKYPMKFLLDHTLLSVAEGKWEKILSQDSRWWRRDAARLHYDVGEGAGLEDMRFQVHLYRRL